MLSIAGSASLNWKDQVFVDITGRNDWSSALVYTNGTGTYSYFYPSVSVSTLLSQILTLPEWVSFGKVRASWGQVGNDTDPYKINSAYSLETTNKDDEYVYSLSIPSTYL